MRWRLSIPQPRQRELLVGSWTLASIPRMSEHGKSLHWKLALISKVKSSRVSAVPYSIVCDTIVTSRTLKVVRGFPQCNSYISVFEHLIGLYPADEQASIMHP